MSGDILANVMLLILIIDPFGNIPIFVTSLKDLPPRRRMFIVLRESLIAYLILIGFVFFGQFFIKMFNFNTISFGMAGGIILFLIALKMLFGDTGNLFGHISENGQGRDADNEPFIVPLAVPYIAGPSAMATVILFVSKHPEQIGGWILALTITLVISTVILLSSSFIEKLVGRKVVSAVEKLMGLVLTAIAVDMFLNGLVEFIKYLKTA